MESIDLPSAPASGTWEVYKDAFAPPRPSRPVKAWERAPVPSHAPRLHGQKIWKRVGIKSQREQDKENFEAAQEELEKEGKGARKRMRVRGAKETMRDATWEEDLLAKSGTSEGTSSQGFTGSTNEESTASVVLDDPDVNALQFIPRKRTNTNHVITPRKPLRQTTLNGQAQTQPFTKSLQPSPEKLFRRRKSMRKSIRKSVAADASAPLVKDKSTPLQTVTEVSKSDTASDGVPEQSVRQSKVGVPATNTLLNDERKESAELRNNDQLIIEQHELALAGESGLSSDFNQPTGHGRKVPLNGLDETPNESSCRAHREEIATEEHKQTMIVDETQSSRILSQSLDPQSPILDSIERDGEAVRPIKATSTPKERNGTSQRRGTRRSTRTAGASPARVEKETAPEAQEAESAHQESASYTADMGNPVAQDPLEESDPKPTNEVLTMPNEPAEDVENVEIIVTTTVREQRVTIPNAEEPVTETLPQLASENIQSGDVQALQNPVAPGGAGRESFEISTEPALEGFAIDPQQEIQDDEFELPAVPALIGNISSRDKFHVEVEPKIVSQREPGLSSPSDASEEDLSPVNFSPAVYEERPQPPLKSEEETLTVHQSLEPISMPGSDSEELLNEAMSPPAEDLRETSTPDPTVSELVEAISENAPPVTYDHDDTDMLRNFLTRVKANKAAKAENVITKRKRSLPHSPLRLPLGDTITSPSPQKMKEDEFDVGISGPSPSKRRKLKDAVLVDDDDTITQPKSIRRSGRTRLPVVKTPLGAPSFIPVRRLGQDGETTVTLRGSEEKELAALTRVNTRKNKGGALSVPEVLAKKAEEKEDPALRQRLLKEVFNEKAKKVKKEDRRKTVAWAEELAQFQTMEGRKLDSEKENKKGKEKCAAAEEKKSPVRVGIRSKIALDMGVKGTLTPKRKRGRS